MLEIPGYFYDPLKKKYFKIEKSQTAPAAASWSAEAVKQRALQEAADQRALRRAQLVRRHVKRSPLRRKIVPGGLLSRELGADYVLPAGAEDGRRAVGTTAAGDVRVAAWVDGVQRKGGIPLARARFPGGRRTAGDDDDDEAARANVACFWVGGEVAYATLNEETLLGTYINTDQNDRVVFGRDASTGTPSSLPWVYEEMIYCPQMSSIKYHQPSHKMLLTSREADFSCGLYVFSPPVSEVEDGHGDGDGVRKRWLIGETNVYRRLNVRHHLKNEWLVHQCTPAPASSPAELCVIGTNGGVLRVWSNEAVTWIAPRGDPRSAQLPQEVFDLDFQTSNHNVLFVGGRRPRVWISDLRAPADGWAHIRHTSSVAHLRSVNPHQILVAGLENTMCLYDVRFFDSRPNGRQPLLTFPEYRNAAHIHTGWDVCPEMNAVAAAQDDGTLALFSLRTGRRLRSPVLDEIKRDSPLKALMFHTVPNEKMPSLWVGEGQALNKFSFGAKDFEDEA